MSKARVSSFGYFGYRYSSNESRPTRCWLSQLTEQTRWLFAVTRSKSDAGRDFENRVRQIKSSKYLDSNRESLIRETRNIVAIDRSTVCRRLAKYSSKRAIGVLKCFFYRYATPRE